MREEINSFMFYNNYYLLIKLLSKKDREKISSSILEFMFEDIEPNFDENSQIYAVWTNIKMGLNTSKKNALNGKKGGAPTGNNNAKKTTQKQPKKQAKKQPKEETKKQTNNISTFYFLLSNFKIEELLKNKIEEWLNYKNEREEFYTETGLKTLLTEIQNNVEKYGLEKISNLITKCISRGWKGIIFEELKGNEEFKTEWLDKKINKNSATSEEIQAMNELLGDFK